MAKPKVCYISPLSIHSCRWIEAFTKRNYNTILITDSKTWIAPTPRSTKVFTLPTLDKQSFVKRLIPNLLTIMKVLKGIKPDMVNLHVQHHYTPAIVFSGTYPYVLTSWGLEVLELPNADSPTRMLAKMAATFARKIVVDAECLKRIWMTLGVSENKIEVIPFGVDTDLFHPQKNTGVRKKLQIKQSDVVVISTRHFFNDHYNIECLIKAIPFVVKQHKDVKFILKGTGPLEDYLKKLVEKLKVSRYVRFVGSTLYEEIALYLAGSDIYVSTCFVDSTSVSLLEAMACGLAPIVTDIPGNREWIEDVRNGLIYPPKNHEVLAEKIAQLIESESERRLYGERCCRIVQQKAEWAKCVEKMEAVYRSIL